VVIIYTCVGSGNLSALWDRLSHQLAVRMSSMACYKYSVMEIVPSVLVYCKMSC
jgi:uncharacterized metal-binding protein